VSVFVALIVFIVIVGSIGCVQITIFAIHSPTHHQVNRLYHLLTLTVPITIYQSLGVSLEYFGAREEVLLEEMFVFDMI